MSPLKKYETPRDIAEMRSLAEEAEAEAAEAEALAAAARARARAIRLRREAELVESDHDAPSGTAEAETVEAEIAAAASEPDAVAAPQAEGPSKVAARKAEPSKLTKPAEEAEETEPVGQTEEITGGETATAHDPEGATAESGRRLLPLRRPKLSEVAVVLAVLVVLASVGASVEMSILHRNAARERQQVEQFAAAARQGVVTLTSLDFEHAKESVQRIEDVATGDFKADFLKMADDFTRTVEESKVVAQGSVQATAVERDTMTENSAVVLVASTAEITNSAGAKQDPRKYRLIVTMTRDGGQLKMSRVEFVP
ncbi:hypothetical protein [Mycobacterium vicinigordonae]|uniref:hypothetical protein n=1 Tax=Mycobacterium vicinigordonae TaxID=1719132 RepID=UPI003CCDCD0C